MWTSANEGCKNNNGDWMRAEGLYNLEYDPNFSVAVNEQSVSSINAGYRYLRRTRELRSSRLWTTGLLVLLPLTAVISVKFVSVANAAIVGGPPRSTEPFGAIQLSSCKLSGVPQPARCGVLEVPENPNRPAGRQLKIGVAVIPAIGGQPRPDPIAVLMGGPGEDAIGSAEIYARNLAPLRQDRDILLVDQRGTGRSAGLDCELFSPERPEASLRDLFPLTAVERCERRLSAQADLTQYTYDRFANDLEQVRRALGYGPLNLFASSYGTRAAQVYVRMYPESVRTVYMGSVVPIDVPEPLPFAKTEQAAIEKMFDTCAADSACNTAFPRLRDEFRQISARLSSGSVRVAAQGHSGSVQLYRGRVAEWFRSKLYRPRSSTALPWMIHRAYLGDWSPISEDILSDARDHSAFSFGLFFSITCSEDIPFIRENEVAGETEGAFLGDYRVRQQQAACRQWPKASLPEGYREPVRSSVPTVFASGDTDGGTPLWFMERAANGFSHRLEVVLRGQGHTEWNECIAKIYKKVVISGSVGGGGTSTCPLVPRPPFRLQ
jgi:pimeloyl-ACP methyl ester carboxylesterase